MTMSSKYILILTCFGLTKNPTDGSYMLVTFQMQSNLRKYLQLHHNELKWNERIKIIHSITYALLNIYRENIIHRDLHSGNILYHKIDQTFRISDLGFCGPVDKPLDSIYGNLPYVAPEVIAGKETTFASDIYSFGMLMWEVSSGQPPFINYTHDFDLAMRIINGMRPKIVPGTPLEYQELMKQCWDADPKKRPNADILIKELIQLQNPYQNIISETNTNNTLKINETNISDTSNSRIHQFGKLPEPRNATEGMVFSNNDLDRYEYIC
jgi:serine/threonine protein kinase